MTDRPNRQWLLARRPTGPVSVDDFRLVETPAPVPGEGEVLVRNLFLSVDPTQRGWMAGDTYMPAVKLGEVMRAFAAGEVVESRAEGVRPGDRVHGLFGWQEYAVARPGTRTAPTPLPTGVAYETAMSALGITGLTAYFGILDVGRPVKGETVVVSGAAGATGSMAGQIARILGCRVVGVAGGPDKCRTLTGELGFHAAVDYRAGGLVKQLGAACPDGVHVFFDNVGGAVLDAALALLAMRGRVVLCGGISQYDTESPAGPRNYLNLIARRGRMEGFLVLDYLPRAAEAVRAISGWLAEGKLVDRVDVAEGIESAPAALLRLFKGENRGKQLVRVAR